MQMRQAGPGSTVWTVALGRIQLGRAAHNQTASSFYQSSPAHSQTAGRVWRSKVALRQAAGRAWLDKFTHRQTACRAWVDRFTHRQTASRAWMGRVTYMQPGSRAGLEELSGYPAWLAMGCLSCRRLSCSWCSSKDNCLVVSCQELCLQLMRTNSCD